MFDNPDSCNTPVAMLVFNRPQTTSRVFSAIRKARPKKLLLVADGPRADRSDEVRLCREVRDIVTSVDWPCEVFTNFSETNLGCKQRVISGLNWVFSLVEEAIILEDDCLPDASFFPFCSELLHRYRNDLRVASICGTSLTRNHEWPESSYYFSQLGGIWGWATWRSRWLNYDPELRLWPTIRKQNRLKDYLVDDKAVALWTRFFDQMHDGTGPSTWDYQWVYSCFINHALIAVSRNNLITNIGYGADATRTTIQDDRLNPPVSPMKFPLHHPLTLIPERAPDRYHMQTMCSTPWRRVKGKWQRILSR